LKLKDMGLVTDPELIELLKMEDTFEAVEGGPRSVAPVTELVKHAQQ
jgi:hypothetical protein